MANHKSAAKRHRQNLKKRQQNRLAKSAIRTTIKGALSASSENKSEEAKQLFLKAEKMLSSAATKGILNKNSARRRISRLATAVKSA